MGLVVFAIIFTVISTYERSWTEESSFESIVKEADEFAEEIQKFHKLPSDKLVNIVLKMKSDLQKKQSDLQKKQSDLEKKDSELEKKDSELGKKDSELEKAKLQLEVEKNKTKSAITEAEEETNLRKTMQCLMDFGELVESFVEWCYPDWAGFRKPKSYGEDVLKPVLYNLENAQVQHLKTKMTRANISDEKFIRAVNSLVKSRNEDAHLVLRPIERQDVYPVFLKSKNPAEKVVIRAILSFMFRITDDDKLVLLEDLPETTPETIDPEDVAAAEKMRQDTEEQRKVYRLIYIPNFKLTLRGEHGEESLEKSVKDFVEQLNGEGDSNIRMTCAFIAATEIKRGALILFDSFHSALKMFNHIKATPEDVGLYAEELDKMKIESVAKNLLFGDDVAQLKITGKSVTAGLNQWDQNVAISEVKTILKTEIVRCVKMTKGEYSVFCSYKTFESVLIAYQTVKERLRSRNIAAEVSIVKTADVRPNKLPPVDIEVTRVTRDKLNVTLKTAPFPKFRKPSVVGFFDVDHNRKIKSGARNLKYLFKDSNSMLPFGLDHGFQSFVEKNRSLDNEEKLNILLQWLNKESDLKGKILSEYTEKNPSFTFVSYRGLLSTVMKTPFEYKNGWRICASKVKNLIFLSAFCTDEEKELLAKPRSLRQRRFEFWGYKFQQYLLTESPEKYPDTTKPINSNEEFYAVFHSRLNGNGLLYGAEIDGVDHNDCLHQNVDCSVLNNVRMVELKTSRHIEFEKQKLHHKRHKLLSWWCQTFIVGIENVTVGFRNDNGLVEELNSYRVKDLPRMSDNLWSAAGCMRFLDDFLNFVKATLMNEPDTSLWCFDWSPRFGHVKSRRLQDKSEYVIVPPWFSL